MTSFRTNNTTRTALPTNRKYHNRNLYIYIYIFSGNMISNWFGTIAKLVITKTNIFWWWNYINLKQIIWCWNMTLGHNTYKYMNDTTFRWCYYMLYVILFGTIFSIKLDIQVSFFFFFFFPFKVFASSFKSKILRERERERERFWK